MKNVVLILFLSFSFIQLSTAQTENNHEIGIRLSGFDNVDFMYKKYINENKLMRLRLASVGFSHDRVEFGDNRTQFNFALAIGRERRKAINEKLDFVIGHEFQLFTNISNTGGDTQTQLRGGIGLVLGFNYEINESFNVGIETIPSIGYTTSFGSPIKTHSYDLGFNTNAASLLFTYKF